MKLYTRFGDDGRTRLPGGETTDKRDSRIVACGDLDELNAQLGAVIAAQPAAELAEILQTSQSIILEIGAWVAAIGAPRGYTLPATIAARTADLESSIDRLQGALPELRQFILPGGTTTAAALHVARAVCRRAERELVGLHGIFPNNDGWSLVLAWINRLSDWLFAAARMENSRQGVSDPLWTSQGGAPTAG